MHSIRLSRDKGGHMRKHGIPPICGSLFILFILSALTCNTNKDIVKKDIHEIQWITNLDSALVLASEQNKPLMVDFMATWCPPCRTMEDSTFSNPDIIRKSTAFITVRIDVDKQGGIADKYNGNAGKYGGVGIPNILFMTGEEKVLKHPIGYRSPEALAAIMDSVLQSVRIDPNL
jgi:thiol:disulfide interchange protein